MKKVLLIAGLLLCLTGCNYQVIDTTFSYKKAVCNYGGKEVVYFINSWMDYEGEQIQIRTNDGVYLISTNQCYLVK